MSKSKAATLVVGSLVIGTALACGGSTESGSTSLTAACDRLFAVAFASCGQTAIAPSEMSRAKMRFEQDCVSSLGLPGSNVVGKQLDACISAFEAAGCVVNGTPPECSVPGSLANGSKCNSALQCQSGDCEFNGGTSADGGTVAPACGTCQPEIPIGQTCGSTLGNCVSGATCNFTGTTGTCLARVAGDVGATCGTPLATCKSGLFCDATSNQCAVPAGSGAACTDTEGCAAPLVCTGSANGPRTCQNTQPSGAPCTSDGECASGLGCDTSTHQCGALVWGSAGQPCGNLTRCVVGSCSGPPNGQCPTVIADGQPCSESDNSTTCDTFASCMPFGAPTGTCTLGPGMVCK